MLEVNFNRYFGAWQLKQKRKLYEDFNFTHRQTIFHEIVKMQICEGACLSALGLVKYDLKTGICSMTSLMAVLAGGVSEAKKYLKMSIRTT